MLQEITMQILLSCLPLTPVPPIVEFLRCKNLGPLHDYFKIHK